MFTALAKTALAATVFALSLGAAGNASALSIRLAPGVGHVQKCFDKPVKVTKYVKVLRHGTWIAVPKTVIVTKTVCKDYYSKAPARHHETHGTPVHHAPAYGGYGGY